MKKTILYIAVPALVLLSAMIYLLCTGEQSAAAVRESVVRFHVVADSNDPEDQVLKLKVRDGLFSLIQTLFEGCADQEEALQTARRNQALLEERAEQILQENGSTAPVTLEIGTRFFHVFPPKSTVRLWPGPGCLCPRISKWWKSPLCTVLMRLQKQAGQRKYGAR